MACLVRNSNDGCVSKCKGVTAFLARSNLNVLGERIRCILVWEQDSLGQQRGREGGHAVELVARTTTGGCARAGYNLTLNF